MGAETARTEPWSAPPKSRPPMSHRKSDLGIPCTRKICQSSARCAVPECRGISHADATFREALWDRFFTAAPRPRTPSELLYSDRRLRSKSSPAATILLLAGHDAQPGQEHPRDADHAVLALALFLVLARDHFVAPGHRLADVAEADLREFAQDLLNLDLGALGPAAQDFRTSCRDLSILP